MNVIVKGRNTHVSSHMKKLATTKLEKVERFMDRITSMEVEFAEEHNPRIADKHLVEVTMATKQHVLRAKAAGPDQASAVDMVLDKLEAQVKRLKGKYVRRGERTDGVAPGHAPNAKKARANGKRARKTASEPLELDEELPRGAQNGHDVGLESDATEQTLGGAPSITRVKRFAIKPMTAEEAVLQMESLGHDFYLFVDAASAQAGVVYRRRDGSFGLIEPD